MSTMKIVHTPHECEKPRAADLPDGTIAECECGQQWKLSKSILLAQWVKTRSQMVPSAVEALASALTDHGPAPAVRDGRPRCRCGFIGRGLGNPDEQSLSEHQDEVLGVAIKEYARDVAKVAVEQAIGKVHGELGEARARIANAEGSIARVRELHKAIDESGVRFGTRETVCSVCLEDPSGNAVNVVFPCPTIQVLDREAP